ncbi:hypothetical protein N7466_009646 [Penicillium verhagenii]|uniref:uncharacterized protein n=1 Tax=Penicillium verhagenii TaxID=1562060 RepID=UPI00254573B4|nr:uncharacterized protein N7466_009646 [Penicillium verhagenii]KAJ5921320.1 hypothetical protein N7466_009646 [Penicillium verhagenii]
MAILTSEETNYAGNVSPKSIQQISEVMEQTWANETFWLQPWFSKHGSADIAEILPFYWVRNVGRFSATKVKDKQNYDTELRGAFGSQ